MNRVFQPDSPYKKQARFLAWLWTLLIFVGCLMPGKELPQVNVPFVDKWVHLVMFGGFTFLWLCVRPAISFRWLVSLFLIATSLGALIELLQGMLTFRGRSMEFMDAVADAVGAFIGVILFYICAKISRKFS